MASSAICGTDKAVKTRLIGVNFNLFQKKTTMKVFLIYLLIINLISAGLFIFDKISAKKNGKRVAEISLHLMELLGGVFAIIVLMYAVRHKNRKFKYFIFTYLILILWIAAFLMIRFELYRLANL